MRNKSTIVNEYRKQRKRIQQAIRRLDKQGYITPQNILPNIPKKITSGSVRKLAKITPESIRQKSEFILKDTGEVIKAKGNKKVIKDELKRQREEIKTQIEEIKTQIDKIEYKTRAKKEYEEASSHIPSFSEIVLSRVKEELMAFPKDLTEDLIALINTLVREQGEDAVAQALEDMPEQFHEILKRHAFDSEGAVSNFATTLLEYMLDLPIQYKKDIMDRFEYHEMGYEID